MCNCKSWVEYVEGTSVFLSNEKDCFLFFFTSHRVQPWMSLCVTELKAPLSVPISGVSVVHPYTIAQCASLQIEENRDMSENCTYVNSEL